MFPKPFYHVKGAYTKGKRENHENTANIFRKNTYIKKVN